MQSSLEPSLINHLGSRFAHAPAEPTALHRSLTLVLLLMMGSTILAQRVYLANAPLHGDICAYALIGHEMLRGRQLYSDLWERKPPLLYATFAASELVVGYGRREIFLLSVLAAIVTLGFIYMAGHALGGRVGGLLAAGLWTILCCDLELAANQPDPEVFINIFITAAFALLVRPPRHRPLIRGVVIGGLLACATLYKHNTALVCIALCGAHAVAGTKAWRLDPRRLTESSAAITVIVIAWLGLFAYFAAVGRVTAFVEVVFRQNFSYSGNVGSNLTGSLQFHRLFPPFMYWSFGPAVLVIVFAALSTGVKFRGLLARPGWFIWFAWAVGTWATVGLTGYLYPRYYELWLPVWCVAGGWAGATLLQRDFPGPRALRVGLSAGVFLMLMFRQGAQFELTPQQWVARQFPYFNVLEQNRVGVQLGRLLKPGESFWELGEDNGLYFFSKHSPPVGLLYIDPLIYGNEMPMYWRRLMDDLDRTKPDLVIVSAAWIQFFPPGVPVFPWIKRSYVLSNAGGVPPTYQLWLRRGSDLERRLAAPKLGA